MKQLGIIQKIEGFRNLPSGQSSPGNEQSVQQDSNAIRQMPQLSSLATQRHVATPTTSNNQRNKKKCVNHD